MEGLGSPLQGFGPISTSKRVTSRIAVALLTLLLTSYLGLLTELLDPLSGILPLNGRL